MSILPNHFSSVLKFASRSIVRRKICSAGISLTGSLGIGTGIRCKRTFSMTTRSLDANRGDAKGVRRFAPLEKDIEIGAEKVEVVRTLKGIIFDMDGTLCEPQTYMFGQMRNALGIDKTIDILDHIYSLPVSDQEAAHEKIRTIEREAMLTQVPQPGLQTLFTYLATLTPPSPRNPNTQPPTPSPPPPNNPSPTNSLLPHHNP
ncbi:73d021ed-ac7f-46a5-9172-06cd49d7c1c6 [Sclerotinia trifoliorum]|uniref:73d021ed-ac7f-46a5-9172-06cd49d7c1c6 n=1 Tax=Sclerotinia trifoliorum TaxID=28548 RepID=A0A8H2ZQW4_9HELO|nr:73d021ed-ac7f-46a5-9172-06cd49d7c1c6 [Sclerotinia trifoliorum]